MQKYLCSCVSLRVVACRCVSLRVVACRCVSLRVVACRCVSLRVVACRCVTLRDVACRCVLLFRLLLIPSFLLLALYRLPYLLFPPLPPSLFFSLLLSSSPSLHQVVTQRMLSKLGYTAEFYGSGDALLENLENRVFDVILLDLRMPGYDGFECARRYA